VNLLHIKLVQLILHFPKLFLGFLNTRGKPFFHCQRRFIHRDVHHPQQFTLTPYIVGQFCSPNLAAFLHLRALRVLIRSDDAADVASRWLRLNGLSGQECPLHITCIQHVEILQAAARVEQDYGVFAPEESAG